MCIKGFRRFAETCGAPLWRGSPHCTTMIGSTRHCGFAVPPQSGDEVGALSRTQSSRTETMMMRPVPVATAMAILVLSVQGGLAQDVSPPTVPPAAPPAPSVTAPAATPSDPEDGRYSFHRVGDSFVRLDGRTGQVSVCSRENAGWACRVVPDERTALEEAIGRLQGDNAALKKDMLARGLPLPSGVRAEPPPAAPDLDKGKPAKPPLAAKPGDAKPGDAKPSDAELDRMLGFIEKVWRRLVEVMVEFQRDMQRKG